MKEFCIIFVIYLTVVLGEQPSDSKIYDIFGYFVNETCATKYPIIKENISRIDYKRSGQQVGCAFACLLEQKYGTLDYETLLGKTEDRFIRMLRKENHEHCMKEEGNCKKAACLMTSAAYKKGVHGNLQYKTCMETLYPDVLIDNNPLKLDACDAVCFWESRGWFTDGKPSADEQIASPDLDGSLSDLFKIMKVSYEACKTVNGTCERAFCTREDYKIRLRP